MKILKGLWMLPEQCWVLYRGIDALSRTGDAIKIRTKNVLGPLFFVLAKKGDSGNLSGSAACYVFFIGRYIRHLISAPLMTSCFQADHRLFHALVY